MAARALARCLAAAVGAALAAQGEAAGEQTAEAAASATETTTSTTKMRSLSQQCNFTVEPRTPYAWDVECKVKGIDHLGCKADGEHQECRFCGEAPYLDCPKCEFEDEPLTRWVWDNKCVPDEYTNGCFADGIHFECRFCGDEGLDPCPTTTTTTMTATTTPTTWAMDVRRNAEQGGPAYRLRGDARPRTGPAAAATAALLAAAGIASWRGAP